MAREIAKVGLNFLDVSDDMILNVDTVENNISIYVYSKENPILGRCIHLDIPTAIKLHKTLRTEINKAKEVNNV